MFYASDVLYNYDILCTIDYKNVFLNGRSTICHTKLKSSKAAGIDMICNEILKQPHFLEPVCIFENMFQQGCTMRDIHLIIYVSGSNIFFVFFQNYWGLYYIQILQHHTILLE